MNKKKLPRAIRPSGRTAETATLANMPVDNVLDDREDLLAAEATSLTGVNAPAFDLRRASAVKVVERFSLWSGAAGLIPMPLVDLAAVGGVQIQMLRRLSQIYGVPFSKNRGKALIAGFAGTMIPATTGIGMASFVKSVPLIGTAVGGIATPALAVGATYAIGMLFIQHFATGGTLLDFETPDYREFIKAQTDTPDSRSKVTQSSVD